MKSFDIKLKKGNKESKKFTIRNGGGGILSVSLSCETKNKKKNWLKIPPGLCNFTITSGKRQDIEFEVDTHGLPSGFKDDGTVKITSNVGTQEINVNLLVAKSRSNIVPIVLVPLLFIVGIVFSVYQHHKQAIPRNSSILTASPFSVINHLMTGITDDEFNGKYKNCATPPKKSAFLDTDLYATLWFHYTNGTVGDIIIFKWYKPNGFLYREDKMSVGYVEGCRFPPLYIKGYSASYETGQWQVKVYRNGEFLFSDTFTISKPPPPPPPAQSNSDTITIFKGDDSKGLSNSIYTNQDKNYASVKTLGMVVKNPTAREANNGIIVTKIKPGSSVDKAGIVVGDIIEEIDRQKVTNLNKFVELLSNRTESENILAYVKRNVGQYIIIKDTSSLQNISQKNVPTIKIVIEENDKPTEVMISLPIGFRRLKVGDLGRVYFIDNDKTAAIIADVKVSDIFEMGNRMLAKVLGHSTTISIEEGHFVKFQGDDALQIGNELSFCCTGKISFEKGVVSGEFKHEECVMCHTVQTPDIVKRWKMSKHASSPKGMVRCDTCHGNNHQQLRTITWQSCVGCHTEQFAKDYFARYPSVHFQLKNHLMTGFTREESYKECATPLQKYTFFDTDKCATQWSSYQNATPGDTITWKWYKPDGYLCLESKGVIATVDGCWRSDINIVDYASYYPGQWQVKVYRNGEFLFSDTFTIEHPSKSVDDLQKLLDKAFILYRDGKYKEAINKWEEVLNIKPDNLEAKYNIEIAREKIKQTYK